MHTIEHFRNRFFSMDRELRMALASLAALLFLGTTVFHFTEGWSVLDAAYFSVITLTTIGYGDMHPTMPLTKLFTIFFVLVGVGLAFYTFTAITRHFFESEQKDIRRLEHEVEHIEEILTDKKSR